MFKSRKRTNLLPRFQRVTTREIALISMFSALWISAQITLGPSIGQLTQVHGVVQRLFGWLMMLILAEITQKFGRVTMMATIAALGTRVIRQSASLYPWVLAIGYALGGLVFDALFFVPFRKTNNRRGYLLLVTVISGLSASIPYHVFQLYSLGLYPFIAQSPYYIYSIVKGVILNIFGIVIGMSIAPRIKAVVPHLFQNTEG